MVARTNLLNYVASGVFFAAASRLFFPGVFQLAPYTHAPGEGTVWFVVACGCFGRALLFPAAKVKPPNLAAPIAIWGCHWRSSKEATQMGGANRHGITNATTLPQPPVNRRPMEVSTPPGSVRWGRKYPPLQFAEQGHPGTRINSPRFVLRLRLRTPS